MKDKKLVSGEKVRIMVARNVLRTWSGLGVNRVKWVIWVELTWQSLFERNIIDLLHLKIFIDLCLLLSCLYLELRSAR